MTASGADFALSIDVPDSITVSSEFDAVLRGTSVNKALVAYSALLEYDATALTLIAAQTGFAGTAWEAADFQSVTEEPGGKIRIAAVMELPSAPGGPSSVAPGQNLSFLKLRFRAEAVQASVNIDFAGTVDDNLLADVDLIGHDTANGLELTPASFPILELIREIEVTPLALDFGQVALGSSSTRQIVVLNAGLSNLEIMTVSLGSGTSDDFEITVAPSLPLELAPDGELVVQVAYSPSNVGSDNGTVIIESDDPDESTVTVSLAGTGVPVSIPEIDVTPSAIDYGDVFVGSSASGSVKISNVGSGPLSITSLQLSASPDFAMGAIPALPTSVLPSGELVVEVTYNPSNVGPDFGSLVIESDDADEQTVRVPVSGGGIPVLAPEIDVTPLSVNFGDVIFGTSKEETLRITNTGNASLNLTAVTLSSSSSSEFSLSTGLTLPASVPAGGEAVVQVTYSPSNVGSDNGTVIIESDDADESSVSVPLSGAGTAIPAPEIDVKPLSIDFGNVEIDTTSEVSLSIANKGTLPLDLTMLRLDSVSSPDFGLVGVPPLPLAIQPGEEFVFRAVYVPGELGSDFGSVFVRSNDEDESFLMIDLSGFGVPEQREGLVAHLPLNCSAEDIISGETGLAIGTVRCAPDRFSTDNGAVQFGSGGFVAGLEFPVVAGDFVLEAWIRPELGSEGSPAEIFAIHNEQKPAEVPALTVEWERGPGLVRAKRALGDSAEFEGLANDWHHLLLARTGAKLSLYVDGQLKGVMTDDAVLGGAYTLGASPHSLPLYHGMLDELMLESGTLAGDEDAIRRVLRGGPSVYVHPSDRVKALTANPGFTVEALDLRLSSAGPGSLELTELKLAAQDVTEGEGEIPALDYLRNGRLVLQTECGDQESETVVAELVVSEVVEGTARIELAGTEPVVFPAGGDVCFVALFDLTVDAPLDRVIQFTLENLEDLEIVDSVGVQYLAGERLVNEPALRGDQLWISAAPPPELELEFASVVPTIEARGAVDDAELHALTLTAGANEGLKLTEITYRAAEGSSLDGVRDVRLFADLNSNGLLDAHEEGYLGAIDTASGSVRFSALGIEIPASTDVDVVVLADLEFYEPPVDGGAAEGFSLPLAAPWRFPQIPLLVASGLLALLVVRCCRYRPKLAGAVALVAVGCLFGFGAGCSGGGGGGKSSSTLSQSFQLVVASADDIRTVGLRSETEPVLVDFPADGIAGALYVVSK